MSKVRGGIGAMSDHLLGLFEQHGGELRRHVKVARIVASGGRVEGVALGDGEVVTAPVVVSNLDPTATFTQLLDRDALPDGLRPAGRRHRPPGGLLPDPLRPQRAARVRRPLRGAQRGRPAPQRDLLRHRRADAARLRGMRPGPGARRRPSFNLPIPTLHDPDLAPPGKHAASSFAFYFPIGADHAEQARLRDEMADRIVAKIAAGGAQLSRPDRAPVQLPGLHLRADVRLHRRRLHPRPAAAGVHGTVPARAPGLARQPVPIEGLYLCGAGCHGGPGVTFIPGYNCGYAVLDAAGSPAR